MTNFKITVITALFILLYYNSFSQDGIVIKNSRSGKSVCYKKNTELTYATKQDYEYVKGQLNSMDDSSMVVDGIRIAFKNIHSIQRKNRLHKAARIAGIPFLFLGCVITGSGISNIISKPNSENGKNLLLVGAGCLTIGYLPYFINFREYVIDEKKGWMIQAVTSPK